MIGIIPSFLYWRWNQKLYYNYRLHLISGLKFTVKIFFAHDPNVNVSFLKRSVTVTSIYLKTFSVTVLNKCNHYISMVILFTLQFKNTYEIICILIMAVLQLPMAIKTSSQKSIVLFITEDIKSNS